jgi:hypothetical protein
MLDLWAKIAAAAVVCRWTAVGDSRARHLYGPAADRECMHYALQVCPYLALPSYAKRIDARTVRDPEPNRIFMDQTQIPERPLVFVCVGASGQSIRNTGDPFSPIYVTPERPYKAIEYWKDGQQISQAEAIALLREAGVIATESGRLPPPKSTHRFNASLPEICAPRSAASRAAVPDPQPTSRCQTLCPTPLRSNTTS